MIRDGLIDETRYLWENGLLAGTAAQAIGSRELLGLSGRQRNPRELYRAVKTPKQKLCKKAAYLAEKG